MMLTVNTLGLLFLIDNYFLSLKLLSYYSHIHNIFPKKIFFFLQFLLFYGITNLFYTLNKKKIESNVILFQTYSNEMKRPYNTQLKMYIIGILILFAMNFIKI